METNFLTSDIHHLLHPVTKRLSQISTGEVMGRLLLCQQPKRQVGPILLMFYVTKNYMSLNGSSKLNKKINSPRKLLVNNF